MTDYPGRDGQTDIKNRLRANEQLDAAQNARLDAVEAGGTVGPQGEQGAQGEKGDTGSQGPTGEQGPQGDAGPQGLPGADGQPGATGPQGPKGDAGDTGAQGSAGATGAQGPQGVKGDTGDTGPQGQAGPQGAKGDTGDAGPQGIPGADGQDGAHGPQGPSGDDGADGLSITQVNAAIALYLLSNPPASSVSAIQLSNLDIITDINTSALTIIPIGGTALTLGTDFTQIGHQVRANFTGTVRLSASIFMYTDIVQRAAVGCEFFRNGIALKPRFNTSYIRRTSGHNHASCACPSYLVTCTDGDLFDIRGQAGGATGVVRMSEIGNSFFSVERAG